MGPVATIVPVLAEIKEQVGNLRLPQFKRTLAWHG